MLAWLTGRIHAERHRRRLPVANRAERRRLDALERHHRRRHAEGTPAELRRSGHY